LFKEGNEDREALRIRKRNCLLSTDKGVPGRVKTGTSRRMVRKRKKF